VSTIHRNVQQRCKVQARSTRVSVVVVDGGGTREACREKLFIIVWVGHIKNDSVTSIATEFSRLAKETQVKNVFNLSLCDDDDDDDDDGV